MIAPIDKILDEGNCTDHIDVRNEDGEHAHLFGTVTATLQIGVDPENPEDGWYRRTGDVVQIDEDDSAKSIVRNVF